MLKMMRRKNFTRDLVIVIVVVALAAYVLVGFGSAQVRAQGDTIAKLGSARIKQQDLTIQRERYRNLLQQGTPEQINTITAGALISEAVMLDGANKSGIQVSDEELRQLIINSRTLSDGQYLDSEQYRGWIRRQYGMQVESYEEYLRDNALKVDKFRTSFANAAYVPASEIEKRFTENNQKVKLEMMILATFDVQQEVDLTEEAALKAFYENNQERFKTGDLRQIRYVDWELGKLRDGMEISDAEVENHYNQNRETRYKNQERVKANHILVKAENRTEEEALALAQQVKKELDGGLDFAEAAKKYSEDDGNKDRGGDLGVFPRARMVPEFSEPAFAMAVGTISDPVKTQFGYHIIQKTEHLPEGYTELEAVKSSIVNELRNNKARTIAQEQAEAFRSRVMDGKDFAEQAKADKLEVKLSRFFDNDRNSDLGGELGRSFQVRRVAFEMTEKDQISESIDVGQKVIVFQWVDEKEPEILDYAIDGARIRTMAQSFSQEAYIENLFKEIIAKAEKDPEKSLKELAGTREFFKENHFRTTDWITAQTLPWEMRSVDDLDFNEDVYAKEKGRFLDIMTVSAQNRLVLARLIDKEAPDMSKLDEERMTIADNIRQEKGSNLLQSYVYHRRETLDPEDRTQALLFKAMNAVDGNQ